jgi:hypothetical protein
LVIGQFAAEVAQQEELCGQDFLFIGQFVCAPFVQQPVKPTDAMKATERSVMIDFILGTNVAEKTVCATRGKELS